MRRNNPDISSLIYEFVTVGQNFKLIQVDTEGPKTNIASSSWDMHGLLIPMAASMVIFAGDVPISTTQHNFMIILVREFANGQPHHAIVVPGRPWGILVPREVEQGYIPIGMAVHLILQRGMCPSHLAKNSLLTFVGSVYDEATQG
jgi:hypothetical protein